MVVCLRSENIRGHYDVLRSTSSYRHNGTWMRLVHWSKIVWEDIFKSYTNISRMQTPTCIHAHTNTKTITLYHTFKDSRESDEII